VFSFGRRKKIRTIPKISIFGVGCLIWLTPKINPIFDVDRLKKLAQNIYFHVGRLGQPSQKNESSFLALNGIIDRHHKKNPRCHHKLFFY
jgi:hypothetical protein